ncbi:MAG: LytTR family DNA-binding domain-containing protein [Thermincola sp.]|jgi:DNA-binding LytR/AlgR family response regulator|nr:LytTR family DNA-binding domain-containing protein [Thermincola sp.]MDT3701933.1 LytTR family DNA-binding domain-containing protein [Thermincola sp.]
MSSTSGKISLIIAEDDIFCRALVKSILQSYPDMVIIGEAENGKELVELTEKLKPDAVMVDVEMPEMNGVEAIKIIAEKNIVPVVVFITGHAAFAAEAFELSSCDYVLKPYTEQRIEAAIEKIRIEIERRKRDAEKSETFNRLFNKLNVKTRAGLLFIEMTDIIFVESDGRKSTIHCIDDKNYEIPRYLSDIERKLDPKMFYRAHQSYLINLKNVVRIAPWDAGTYEVYFDKTNKKALISRKKVKEICEIMDFINDSQTND